MTTQKSAWDNQHPLTSDQITALLNRQFPHLYVRAMQSIGEGWDNTTWQINKKWLFRFPKHKEAETLIKNEMYLLPALCFLPTAIPLPRWIGTASDEFPFVFYGHTFLKGETADRFNLNLQERADLAEPIALFLKTLHQSQAKHLSQIKVEQRVEPLFRLERVENSFQYLVKHNILQPTELLIDYFKTHYQQPVSEERVMAHGDFYARHLLLDSQKKLSAVIDWGDACLAHPAIDLTIVYQFLPSSAHATFWNSYGQVSEETKILSLLRAIHYAMTLSWYSHQVQDQNLLREGLYAIENIRHTIKGTSSW